MQIFVFLSYFPGLYKLDSKSDQLSYKSFKKIHFLWREYMQEILDLSKIPDCSQSFENGAKNFGGRIPAILDENLQLKICRADFHGCFLKVTQATNSCLIGLEGIVVMETRHTFRIIDKKNCVKEIPKQGSSFSFEVDKLLITVSGAAFVMKPSDRAVKKWKRKPPFDL